MRQIRCTEATLIPAAFAIAAPVQWLAVGGGPAKVRATTRSATSGSAAEYAMAASCRAKAPPRLPR